MSFHSALSTEEKQHILDGRCNVIASTASMPKSLKDAFIRATGEQQFALADPGKKYQATDVVEPGLPTRRLVFAGSCEHRWFVNYERGGIGHSYAVLVFRNNSSGALQFEWGGSGFRRANTIKELRWAISYGKFSDDLPYYW